MECKLIATAPRVKERGYSAKHILVNDKNYGWVEAWYEHPHEGSTAYEEGHGAELCMICPYIGWRAIQGATHWVPLPPPPANHQLKTEINGQLKTK